MTMSPGMPSMRRSPQTGLGRAAAGEVRERGVTLDREDGEGAIRQGGGEIPRETRVSGMADRNDRGVSDLRIPGDLAERGEGGG